MPIKIYHDDLQIFWGIFAFFFPLVGLILAVVWFDSRPNRARACIVGILIIVALSIILYIILFGVYFNTILNPSYSGTGTNWNNQGSNSQNNNFKYPSPPNPDNAVYENSADGVLTFYMTEEYLPTVYDQETSSVIAWDNFYSSIYVYDLSSGQQKFTKEFQSTIECVAAYDGKLAVALNREIEVVDLNTFDSQSYNAKHDVHHMEVMYDAIIFSGNDYNTTNYAIYRLSFADGKVTMLLDSLYNPIFAVNHQKQIVYVAERDVSSCDFYYINLKTYYCDLKSEYNQYPYSRYEVFFDGTYVHAFGNLYDTTRGKIKYPGQSIRQKFEKSTPYSTLCINGRYSLTVTTNCKTVVFDSKSNVELYTMDLYATRIYPLPDNKYLALCGDSGYYALIDLSSVI